MLDGPRVMNTSHTVLALFLSTTSIALAQPPCSSCVVTETLVGTSSRASASTRHISRSASRLSVAGEKGSISGPMPL